MESQWGNPLERLLRKWTDFPDRVVTVLRCWSKFGLTSPEDAGQRSVGYGRLDIGHDPTLHAQWKSPVGWARRRTVSARTGIDRTVSPHWESWCPAWDDNTNRWGRPVPELHLSMLSWCRRPLSWSYFAAIREYRNDNASAVSWLSGFG